MNATETLQIWRLLLEAAFWENRRIIFCTELHKLAGSHTSPLNISLFVSLENTAYLDNELLLYLLNKELQKPKWDWVQRTTNSTSQCLEI